MFINRKYRVVKSNTGQSTVEYIILVTAVIAVIIFFVLSPASPFRSKLGNTLETGTNGMLNKAQTLEASHSTAPGASGNSQYIINVMANIF